MSDLFESPAEASLEEPAAATPTDAQPVGAANDPVDPVVPPESAAPTIAGAATPDSRSAVVAAVQGSRDLPPGLRERLSVLVRQAATLDVAGEPLLATRQVLDLLAAGLPPVLKEQPTPLERPAHPAGDAFFAVDAAELSDQQAEQIARTQLQRAGLLRTA